MVQVKRVYDAVASDDGFRILVDRLWPRGLTKEKVHADLWLKEAGPSTELRQWFQHDSEKWPAFQQRYKAELKDNPAFAQLQELVRTHKKVTLLFASKEETHNEAQALKNLLQAQA